jgi:hypothetical protein
MQTADGVKFFKNAIKGIRPQYDLNPQLLPWFLDRVREHSDMYGFHTVLEVPMLSSVVRVPTPHRPVVNQRPSPSTVTSSSTRNLLDMYRYITLEECQKAAKIYFTKDDRRMQDSMMLILFLFNSITYDTMMKLTSEEDIYKIGNDKYSDGVCFLKHLISEVVASEMILPPIDEIRAELTKLNNSKS